MMKGLMLAATLLVVALAARAAERAFPEAAGFGAFSLGGKGGQEIRVTRLDDDARAPEPGMFRWAVLQAGPRVVTFAVAGDVLLKERVLVREPRLTIDGGSAPGLGVCIRGGALEFRGVSDVVIRRIRVRLGDAAGLRAGRVPLRWRPEGSRGLDCISLHECERVIIDRCSLSWSCDEIMSVVRCRGVTVQRCILSEPLACWRLHPYGSRHAFCLNASASTLSVLGCVFAHYEMRGPQFEANDLRRGDDWMPHMEAAGCVMFDFKDSGSRYTTGVEDHREEAEGRRFEFQFTSNRYLNAGEGARPIEAAVKHGIHRGVRVGVAGNISPASGPLLGVEGGALEDAVAEVRAQVRRGALFSTAGLGSGRAPELECVLAEAGCCHARDAVDRRIIQDVLDGRCRALLRSQDEAGGWPRLDGGPERRTTGRLARSIFGR